MTFPFRYIVRYTDSKPAEAQRGLEEFFGKNAIPDPGDTELWSYYAEWMMFDFRQKNGRTFLIDCVLLNPDNLDKKIIDQFKQIAESQNYSNYQILDIKRGEWINLEDVYTGKIYKVYDKLGSESIPDEGTMFVRVAKVDGKWCLVGANSAVYPITYTERMRRNLRNDFSKNKIKLTPKDYYKLMVEQRKNPPKKPQFLTKDQLNNKREELENNFVKKIKKYNAKITFKELLEIFYEENRVNVLDLLLSLGKKGLTERFVMGEMQLLSDIWNHFPHKCLGGKAPIELRPDS